MNPNKAPGPDGMNACFWQRYWHIMGKDVTKVISLRNVIYKIISKVIANCLKVLLDDIISLNQSAFVPSQMIFDNAMIACETIHTMKANNSGKHRTWH